MSGLPRGGRGTEKSARKSLAFDKSVCRGERAVIQ